MGTHSVQGRQLPTPGPYTCRPCTAPRVLCRRPALFQSTAATAPWAVLVPEGPCPSSALPPLSSRGHLFHLLRDCSRTVILEVWAQKPQAPLGARSAPTPLQEVPQLHPLPGDSGSCWAPHPTQTSTCPPLPSCVCTRQQEVLGYM